MNKEAIEIMLLSGAGGTVGALLGFGAGAVFARVASPDHAATAATVGSLVGGIVGSYFAITWALKK